MRVTRASQSNSELCKSLKRKVCGSRTCKPNSPGCVANRQLICNQSRCSVNDVNFVSVGRFCVTPASQWVARDLLVVAITLPYKFALATRRQKFSLVACLPDLLKFHLKFGPLAPADCEIMHVGQQANRPGIGVGLPLQDMYGDPLPDFRFAVARVDL